MWLEFRRQYVAISALLQKWSDTSASISIVAISFLLVFLVMSVVQGANDSHAIHISLISRGA
jgi:hypothetical protein